MFLLSYCGNQEEKIMDTDVDSENDNPRRAREKPQGLVETFVKIRQSFYQVRVA
jgi:hypothetical protein